MSGPVGAAGVTVILDVDGTLVDTNYHHVVAWDRAFRRHDVAVPLWKVHRAIGMGGDRLVAHVAGDQVERARGDEIRKRWEHEFDELIHEIRPIAGAGALIRAVKARGDTVVLASSGKKRHVDVYIDLLDASDVADGWTTSDDVEDSKPAPDLIQIALQKAGGGPAVTVGDSVWDCEAAQAVGIPAFALLTGGFSRQELAAAGAVASYDSVGSLEDALDDVVAAATLPDLDPKD